MEEIKGKNLEELLREIENKYGVTWYNVIHVDITFDSEKGLIAKITPIEEMEVREINILDIKEEYLPEEEMMEELLEKHAHPKINVKISEDGMEVYATIIPGIERKMPRFEEIMEVLHDEGVVFGIMEDEIERMIKEEVIFKPVMVARGIHPTEPVDAKVEYKFPKDGIMELSTFDKNRVDPVARRKIYICRKGDVLVEKKPAVDGKPGRDVFGREIPSKKGKDIALHELVGKNVKLSEDGKFIISMVEGQPYVSNDGKVNVKEIFVVNGDLDYSVGNIDFPGSVWIRGNIDGNFKVISGKDVIIDGIVSGGFHIEAKGSVVIRKGVFGRKRGKIISGGDVSAKFLSETFVASEGSIEVGEYMMNCHAVAKKDVAVFGKGLIVGGKVSAGKSIKARVLGNMSGAKTVVEAGVDFETQKQYYEISHELMELVRELTSLSTLQRRFKMMLDNVSDSENKEISLILINIENKKKTLYERMEKRRKTLEALNISRREKQLRKNALIVASDACYPGVTVSIGDETIKIDDNLGPTAFTFDVVKNGIKATPYKTWRKFLK
ncbi:MAG: hypothetical protein DRP23_04155 [Thermotogae bacterium]|nr:MAG: hypothetical protein DRP23_04155 [Thermotogota bacterium]